MVGPFKASGISRIPLTSHDVAAIKNNCRKTRRTTGTMPKAAAAQQILARNKSYG